MWMKKETERKKSKDSINKSVLILTNMLGQKHTDKPQVRLKHR